MKSAAGHGALLYAYSLIPNMVTGRMGNILIYAGGKSSLLSQVPTTDVSYMRGAYYLTSVILSCSSFFPGSSFNISCMFSSPASHYRPR